MKKIAAFFTAFALFMATVLVLNAAFAGSISMKNHRFGTWMNNYKDTSYSAISDNIKDDTVLFMGSSEFHHGAHTPTFPAKVLKKQGIDAMCIGSSYNQSLSHATALVAVGPKLKSKKVILMVSPSWFNPLGVAAHKSAFAVRFSETEYIGMLKNTNIPVSVKKQIAARTVKLLGSDRAMRARVKKYDRIFLTNDARMTDMAFYSLRSVFLRQQEAMTVRVAWQMHQQKKTEIKENVRKRSKLSREEARREARMAAEAAARPEGPDWNTLSALAEAQFARTSHNEFFMSDELYRTKVRPIMKKKRGTETKMSYASSPEYGDLKLFLDVCRAENMKVQIVILPMNGYWFDYAGFPEAQRRACIPKIKKLAAQYKNTQVTDLYKYSYTKGFFMDTVHPAAKGWLKIDEAVYKFIKER